MSQSRWNDAGVLVGFVVASSSRYRRLRYTPLDPPAGVRRHLRKVATMRILLAFGSPTAAGILLCSSVICLTAQTPVPSAPEPAALSLSCAQMETFLRTAKTGRRRGISVGVTGPTRLTLSDGTLTRDAAVQTIDEKKTSFSTFRGTELNFRDSWQFNVAGYELAKLLGLNMVPPYVQRSLQGGPASVSWWVEDAMMERERVKKRIEPPDAERWNREMYAARIFHELIANSDANMTNLLITKDWRVWMIDFSRAFRLTRALQKPESLRHADRTLLAALRGLTEPRLQQALGRWLNSSEIQAVLARRDAIVTQFDHEIAARGDARVLYDFPRTREPCGTGLW